MEVLDDAKKQKIRQILIDHAKKGLANELKKLEAKFQEQLKEAKADYEEQIAQFKEEYDDRVKDLADEKKGDIADLKEQYKSLVDDEYRDAVKRAEEFPDDPDDIWEYLEDWAPTAFGSHNDE